MTAFNWFQILADLFFLFLILLLLASRVWKRGAGNEADHESYREMIATLSDLIREMKEVSQGLEDRIAEKQAEVTGAVAAADARIERLKDLLNETQRPVSIAIRDQRTPDSDSPEPPQAPVSPQSVAPLQTPEPPRKASLANRNYPASSDGSLFRAPDIERRIRGDEHPIEMPNRAAVESFTETPAKQVRTGRRRATTGDHGSAAASATAAPADGEVRGEDEDERREKYRQALDYARKGFEVLDIARFTGLPRGEVDLLIRTKGKKV